MNMIETYREKHKHPVNRVLHTVGIPAIVVSLLLFFVNWKIALGIFVGGWILQFVGHAVEGNTPAFFKNPVYLLVGPLWWLKKVKGVFS